MLGSFEDLEKDIEKFQNNVMASTELVESLNVTADAFDKRQKEYIDQLKDNRAILDACKKQLEEAHASFIKKAEELNLSDLQRGVEMLKVDVSKKLNIVTIISVLAFIAAVAGIFIK